MPHPGTTAVPDGATHPGKTHRNARRKVWRYV